MSKNPKINISGRIAGENHLPLVIAEIGINHGGNLQTAFKLVDAAVLAGADGVSQAIRRFREDNNQIKLHAYKNFEPEEYIPLLDNTVCAVGNSSSFIRDASFLGTPIVLIGSRQNGREYSDAVTHVKPDSVDIFNAVKKQIKHGKYQASTLYGKYGVSNKIVNKILTLNKYVQKKFHIID